MKLDSQVLVACALFILLIVLCFSWISRELFTGHELPEAQSVIAVNPHTFDKEDPLGNDGTTLYQNAFYTNDTNNLPPQ